MAAARPRRRGFVVYDGGRTGAPAECRCQYVNGAAGD